MKTLGEKFCEANRCNAEQSARKIFWKCLYPHAWLLAPLLGGYDSKFFDADRALIVEAEKAVRLDQVREGVRYYCISPNNRGWLRRTARIRVSAKRLLQLASGQLYHSPAASLSLELVRTPKP